MATEVYSLAVDFGGVWNQEQFTEEVASDAGISPDLLSIELAGDVITLTFSAALSGPEKTVLDGLVAAHVPVPVPGDIQATTTGGTGISTYTTGDLLYSDATDSLAKRGIGTEGKILQVVSGSPDWASPAAGSDEKIKISSDDTTADYLESKVAAGTGITLTTQDPASNESLQVDAAISGIGSGTLAELNTAISDASVADDSLVVHLAGTETVTGEKTFTGDVGVGATPVASTAIDITSTTKGLGLPAMTAAQRTAISSPKDGLLVFDLDDYKVASYQAGWVLLANDDEVVHLAGAEAVNGVKTFGPTQIFVQGLNIGGTLNAELRITGTTPRGILTIGADGGTLISPMTTTERDAIVDLTTGTVIWNETTGQVEYYTGSAWAAVGSGVAPASHAASHENGGGDEISVAGLSGLLADDQNPTSHAFAGADHSTSNLAAVNSKISDATLIDTTDARLSDDRDPNAHAIDGADHTAAGLTTGHVLTATTATTFAFQAPAASGGMESLGWDAGESSIGSILDYAGAPSAFDNGDGIQYSRIWVKGGVEIDRGLIFTEVVASGLNLEIAIYADSAGVPSGNKLASTPLQASVSAGRNLISFSASYTPASDRFVWIGLSNDSATQVKPVLTKDNLPLEINQYYLRWVGSPTMVANKQPEPVPTLDAAADSKMFLVGLKEA